MEALIIVDVQNDFLQGGSVHTQGADSLIEQINNLRQKFQTIIVTKKLHHENHLSFYINNNGSGLFQQREIETGESTTMWPVNCIEGSEGAEFPSSLQIRNSDIIISKETHRQWVNPSAFGSQNFKSNLERVLQQRQIQTIYVCGLQYDYAVGQTAEDAALKGYEVFLVEDCTRGFREESTNSMRKRLVDARVQFIQSYEIA